MVTCLLLSAGLSQRFGSPKALAQIQGETVIYRLQSVLLHSQVDEVMVVLGSRAEEIKTAILKHKKVKVVYNKDYKLGQTSSIKTGLKQLTSDVEAFLILPI